MANAPGLSGPRRPLGSRRPLVFVAWLAVVGAVAAGHDAAGQSCPDGGPSDAASASTPYVNPPNATCDPSLYLSNASDAAGAPTGPGPSTWTGPPGYDASPPMVSGDIYAMLGITNPGAMTFTYTDVMAPYADATGCKAFDSQGHQMVHDCLCDNCFSLLQQCDALNGCKAIAKCAWDTGCDPSAALTSSSSCYPLTGTGGCGAPIDKYGTGSVSTGLSQQLGLCGRNKGCPAQ
jgi:hypothetical protein